MGAWRRTKHTYCNANAGANARGVQPELRVERHAVSISAHTFTSIITGARPAATYI